MPAPGPRWSTCTTPTTGSARSPPSSVILLGPGWGTRTHHQRGLRGMQRAREGHDLLASDLRPGVSPGGAKGTRTPDPLLAKHGQDVQHSLWPGTQRSERPPAYSNVQARWCRLWVLSRPTGVHLQPGKLATARLSGSGLVPTHLVTEERRALRLNPRPPNPLPDGAASVRARLSARVRRRPRKPARSRQRGP
jgi:hypothetical protein